MRRPVFMLSSGLIAAAAAALIAANAQSQSGVPLRYTVDAATMSGLGAMGQGGGMGSMMDMMRGGAPKPIKTLQLDHGASAASPPAPRADHFMPAGAGLGASVPLLPVPRGTVGGTSEYQTPSGRLLLFWGCGERAGPGQPVVIDFSKLARGQLPPGLFMSDIDLPDDWRVTQDSSRTFTTWPNNDSKTDKTVPSSASLIGAHRIAANYSKEINFTLAEDFMPALEARTQETGAGASRLSWAGLDKATGYYAWAISGKDMGRGKPAEMVWWASSKQQAFGGPLWDWISPAGVRRLITAGTVMPPEQRDCTIPAEVVKASGEAMLVNLQAYGPQANFAFPPRPADTRKPWNPEWIARVRFRSSTMLIPGMEGMPGMGGRSSRGDARTSETAEPQAPKKPKCKGLKGLAQRAAGLCE